MATRMCRLTRLRWCNPSGAMTLTHGLNTRSPQGLDHCPTLILRTLVAPQRLVLGLKLPEMTMFMHLNSLPIRRQLCSLTGAAGTSETAARSDHTHSGPIVSDAEPEDVASASASGDNTTSARSDHIHELPLQNTLEFSGTGHLGVSISDIVEHLQQNVRYYTTSTDYSTDGSAAGQVYNTSRYPKNISHVKVELRPPTGIDDAIYRVGVYRVESNNDIAEILGQSADSPEIDSHGVYNFDLRAEGEDDELGIPLSGSERIAILCRRIGAGNTADTGLRHGSEATNSPNESYINAELDFALDNHVVYEHEHPAVGNDTHSHGNFIRGNIRIYYTVTIDHGSLVGDGNIDPEHINSGTATDGQALLADGAEGAAFGDIPRNHRGAYHAATAYLTGQSITANGHLWMAPTNIVAGAGSPSLVSPHAWALISHADQYLGHLLASNSYDLLEGNWYRIGHRLFFTVADASGVTGDALRGGHADIVELTSHHLTQAQAEDETSDTFGQVSGERLSQAVAAHDSGTTGHAPVVKSGIAFPTAPVPVASDQFIFTAEVPSGLDWFATDTTTALTAASKGDFALYDGTQWNRVLNLIPANAGGFVRETLYTETQRTAEVADGTFLRLQLDRTPLADSKIEIDIISLSASIVGEFPAAEFEADHFLLNEIIPSTQTNTDHMIDETMGRPAATAGNIVKSYTTLFIGRGNTASDEIVLVCPEWTAFGLMQITVREIKPAGSGDEAGRPNLFSAHMGATAASTLSTTPTNRLSIADADVITNRGDFTVESGTSSLNAIKVATDGTYLVEFNVHVTDSAAPTTARAQVQADITIVRAGSMLTDLTARTSMYWRGQDDTDEIYVSGTHTVDLDADDQIEIRFATVAAETITWVVGGGESEISVVKIGGGSSSSDDDTESQLAGGLTEQVIVGSRIATTEYGIGTVWTSVVDAISPTISPAIDPDNLLYISVLLRIDSAASIEVFISGAAIRRIVHTTDPAAL